MVDRGVVKKYEITWRSCNPEFVGTSLETFSFTLDSCNIPELHDKSLVVEKIVEKTFELSCGIEVFNDKLARLLEAAQSYCDLTRERLTRERRAHSLWDYIVKCFSEKKELEGLADVGLDLIGCICDLYPYKDSCPVRVTDVYECHQDLIKNLVREPSSNNLDLYRIATAFSLCRCERLRF